MECYSILRILSSIKYKVEPRNVIEWKENTELVEESWILILVLLERIY